MDIGTRTARARRESTHFATGTCAFYASHRGLRLGEAVQAIPELKDRQGYGLLFRSSVIDFTSEVSRELVASSESIVIIHDGDNHKQMADLIDYASASGTRYLLITNGLDVIRNLKRFVRDIKEGSVCVVPGFEGWNWTMVGELLGRFFANPQKMKQ